MRKQYLKLTKDQISRNVIFSSQLLPSGTLHEVIAGKTEKEIKANQEHIARLKDDKFFNRSTFKVNQIRQ